MSCYEKYSAFFPKISTYAFLIFVLTACSGNEGSNYSEKIDNITVDVDTLKLEKLSQKVFKSVPSPVEINSYIRETESRYDKSILCDPNLSNEYLTNYKKALALGVYSSDLAYINMYAKYRDAISYVEAVRWLTSELDISALFDYEKLKFYAENFNKEDSIMFFLAKDFDYMTSYLNEHQKSDDAVLVITGGFIESLHIAISIYEYKPIDELREKILEQKLVIEDMVSMLRKFENRGEMFPQLIKEMDELKQLFDHVEIEVVYGEPMMEENEEGELVIVDQSTSEVKASQQDLEAIISKIKSIRTNIISV